MKIVITFLFILFCWTSFVFSQDDSITAEDTVKLFRDEDDGKLDMSNFLMTKAGFLPIPIVVTNPAVGYGGILAATFFHKSMAESQGYPTVTGLLGGGTANNSWMAGVFHLRSLFDQKVRYSGFVGYSDFNMRFYGLGLTDYFQKNDHDLFYESFLMFHKAQGRLGQSNFYMGGQYLMMDNDIKLRPVPTFLEGALTQDFLISQLSFVVSYDSRNNFFSPNKGVKAELNWNYCAEWLGASDTYNSLTAYVLGYRSVPFVDKLTAACRVEYDIAFDGTPFFIQPFVTNRGVAFARYQDEQMFELETELSYCVNSRWDIIGFFGLGDAFGTGDNALFSDDLAVSGGAGFRYLIARKFGIKVGPDFSYSEDFSFQLVMGSAWTRN